MSLPKTSWPGVASIVLWYKERTAQASSARMSPQGLTGSNSWLSRSWVRIISLMTPCTRSIMAFACGFLTVVGLYLIQKPSIRSLKSVLNLFPLSQTHRTGRGYLVSQYWLNNWDTLAEVKSFSGMWHISTQLVAGSIMVRARTVLLVIFSQFFTFIVKGPMQSTHTVCQGFRSSSFGGSFP